MATYNVLDPETEKMGGLVNMTRKAVKNAVNNSPNPQVIVDPIDSGNNGSSGTMENTLGTTKPVSENTNGSTATSSLRTMNSGGYGPNETNDLNSYFGSSGSGPGGRDENYWRRKDIGGGSWGVLPAGATPKSKPKSYTEPTPSPDIGSSAVGTFTGGTEELTGSRKAIGEALVSDYDNQKKIADQLNKERKESRESLTGAVDDDRLKAIEERYSASEEQMNEWMKGVVGNVDDVNREHLARIGGLQQQLEEAAREDWNRISAEYKDRSADAMVAAGHSINANFDRQIQSLQAKVKEGDPEAVAQLAQLKAAKSQALGAQLSNIKVATNDTMAKLNTTMASLSSSARDRGATFMCYASQSTNEIKSRLLTDILPNIRQQMALDRYQNDMVLEQFRLNGKMDLANFLQTMPIYNVSSGSLMVTLAELYEQQQRENAEYNSQAASGSQAPKKSPSGSSPAPGGRIPAPTPSPGGGTKPPSTPSPRPPVRIQPQPPSGQAPDLAPIPEGKQEGDTWTEKGADNTWTEYMIQDGKVYYKYHGGNVNMKEWEERRVTRTMAGASI